MLMVDGRPRQKPATTMGMGPKRDGPLRRDAVRWTLGFGFRTLTFRFRHHAMSALISCRRIHRGTENVPRRIASRQAMKHCPTGISAESLPPRILRDRIFPACGALLQLS